MPATEENLTILDITAPTAVEIVIRADSKVIWINVDGICRLRVCQIPKLFLNDAREKE